MESPLNKAGEESFLEMNTREDTSEQEISDYPDTDLTLDSYHLDTSRPIDPPSHKSH